jgi:Leucine-rich repeat (LRR) protein
MINLKHLDVSNNCLTSLDGIENLFNLESLYINTNPIKCIKCIKDLINLKELCISGMCELKSISGIEKLINLNDLFITDNMKLESLMPVFKLNNLTDLQCWHLWGLEPFKQLNVIKYVENDKFIIFNYWQHKCKLYTHLKAVVFKCVKLLLIKHFGDNLTLREDFEYYSTKKKIKDCSIVMRPPNFHQFVWRFD